MEWLITGSIIGIVVLLVLWITGVLKKKGNSRFRIRLRCDIVELDDGSKRECLFVEAAGKIQLPHANCSVQHCVKLTEKLPTGEIKPVLSNLDTWRRPNDRSAVYLGEPKKLPKKTAVLKSWTRLNATSLDSFIFSKRGPVAMECEALILPANGTTPIARATASIGFENPNIGYIDGAEIRKEVRASTVKLAMLITGCDGGHGEEEIQFVKEWINGPGSEIPDGEDRDALKSSMSSALLVTSRAHDITQARATIQKLAGFIAEKTKIVDRYPIMEFVMKVARVDGIASQNELQLIEETRRTLRLDGEKTRTLRDKILPVTMHQKMESGIDAEKEDALIGIDPSMPRHDVLRKLNLEYRKWNNRTEHTDIEIRRQAREMVTLIARARLRHKSAKTE